MQQELIVLRFRRSVGGTVVVPTSARCGKLRIE